MSGIISTSFDLQVHGQRFRVRHTKAEGVVYLTHIWKNGALLGQIDGRCDKGGARMWLLGYLTGRGAA